MANTTYAIQSDARATPGHDHPTRALHWVSVISVVVAFVSAWSVDSFDETSRDWLLLVHKTVPPGHARSETPRGPVTSSRGFRAAPGKPCRCYSAMD